MPTSMPAPKPISKPAFKLANMLTYTPIPVSIPEPTYTPISTT